MIKTYHAYLIYIPGTVLIGVDTDAVKLLSRMANDLNEADQDGFERIIIGQVNGLDTEDALNSVRGGKWLEGYFADAQTSF